MLPKMGNDPSEFSSYFKNVESTFAMYEVSKNLRSKFMMPMLNEGSKRYWQSSQKNNSMITSRCNHFASRI